MSDKFLPLELDAESITFYEAGLGWEVIVEIPDREQPLVMYLEQPDGVFEQLVRSGDIEL